MCRAFAAVCTLAFVVQMAVAADPAQYTAENRLVIPANYRQWIFLTSSLDLNYDQPVPGASQAGSLLDNVFVNPAAYAQFVNTGHWPDGTVLVKENRLAATAGTISKSGKYQTGVVSMELHVKDTRRFAGGWAFYVSDGTQPGQYVPTREDCYSCHGEHGAVDTTFVQFYPTLLQIASAKGTLSPGYLKDRAALTGKQQQQR
jgi:hypothetical protein